MPLSYQQIQSQPVLELFSGRNVSSAALAAVEAWRNRILDAGGADISANSQSAHAVFYDSIKSFLSALIMVNTVTPDNLIASLTPFLKTAGNDSWVNHGFVSGDLTVNGLKSDGTKFLDTGFSPVTLLGNGSGGLIVVNTTSSNGNEVDLGCFDLSTTKGFQLAVSATGLFIADIHYNSTAARISASNSSFVGMVSAQRTATNSLIGYRANTSVGHQTLATTTNAGGTAPTSNVYAFCQNAGGAGSISTKRISNFAVTSGLTAAQDLIYYNAFQTLRTALGGGTV